MKQLTLSITLFLFAVILTAQEAYVPDFNIVKKGDWFELEFTDDLGSGRILFSPGDESFDGQLWIPDSLFKITFRCNVVKKVKDRLQLSFKISRILLSKKVNRESREYYSGNLNNVGYQYFDSKYLVDEHKNSKVINLMKSDSLVLNISTEN